MKISTVCLWRKWAYVENKRYFHRIFQNEIPRYSLNFGNNLQMVVEIGKKDGFTSNFDTPWPFTQSETELLRKMANSQSDGGTASCIPE